jgi:restriction endonuclease Mrr
MARKQSAEDRRACLGIALLVAAIIGVVYLIDKHGEAIASVAGVAAGVTVGAGIVIAIGYFVNAHIEYNRAAEEAVRLQARQRVRFEQDKVTRAEALQRSTMEHEERMRSAELQKRWLILRTAELALCTAMDPYEFEQYVADVLEAAGMDVEVTPGSGDEGVDVRASSPDGLRIVVQCKQYIGGMVGRPTLQAILGQMHNEGAHQAWVVTTGQFSEPAKDFGRKNNMVLVDGLVLSSWAVRLGAHVRFLGSAGPSLCDSLGNAALPLPLITDDVPAKTGGRGADAPRLDL